MCPFLPNNGGVVKFVFFYRYFGDDIPCTLNVFQSFNFHKADVLSLCVNQVRWIFSPHNSNFLYNQCLPGMQVVRYLPEFRHVDRLKIDFCLLFIFMAPFEPPVSRIFWYFRKISLASLDFSRDAPVFFWKRGNFSCSAIFMKCELDKFVNFFTQEGTSVYSSGVDPVIGQFELVALSETGDHSQWVRTMCKTRHTHDVRALAITPDFLISGGE